MKKLCLIVVVLLATLYFSCNDKEKKISTKSLNKEEVSFGLAGDGPLTTRYFLKEETAQNELPLSFVIKRTDNKEGNVTIKLSELIETKLTVNGLTATLEEEDQEVLFTKDTQKTITYKIEGKPSELGEHKFVFKLKNNNLIEQPIKVISKDILNNSDRVFSDKDLSLVEFLIKKEQVKSNVKDKNGNTLLHVLAFSFDIDKIKSWLTIINKSEGEGKEGEEVKGGLRGTKIKNSLEHTPYDLAEIVLAYNNLTEKDKKNIDLPTMTNLDKSYTEKLQYQLKAIRDSTEKPALLKILRDAELGNLTE